MNSCKCDMQYVKHIERILQKCLFAEKRDLRALISGEKSAKMPFSYNFQEKGKNSM